MNVDLVAFVRARLDEDEQTARAATAGPWTTMGQRVLDSSPPSDRLGIGMAVGHAAASADYNETAVHIARQDPAATLRRIARDRAILNAYEEVADMDTDDAKHEYAYGRAVGLGYAVRQMAAEHDGHPDYKPSWNSGFTP
ncbi:DUF6221 family protein [Streptomyces sp. NPDC102264]|uniref:DUF6221 family protein n=1 Tax=Streptomyces sp. NPDC102264 TaxID=3366149 RepID=UPI0038149FDC